MTQQVGPSYEQLAAEVAWLRGQEAERIPKATLDAVRSERDHAGRLLDETVVRAQQYEVALRRIVTKLECGKVEAAEEIARGALASPLERLNTMEIRDVMDGEGPYAWEGND